MIEELSRIDDRFLTDEQHTLWGLAQLQHGDVPRRGRRRSGAARAATTNRGPEAAADVALAAALVAGDQAEEALEICAEAEELVVTFVDRYRLELARGLRAPPHR